MAVTRQKSDDLTICHSRTQQQTGKYIYPYILTLYPFYRLYPHGFLFEYRSEKKKEKSNLSPVSFFCQRDKNNAIAANNSAILPTIRRRLINIPWLLLREAIVKK